MTYQRQIEAVGDGTRRTLLERLRRGAMPVGELAKGLPVSRPAVSQHLRILKEARLVREQTVGTRHYYSLDPRGFASLRAYFDEFWEVALQAFKHKVEEQ
ncbi:MAG: metalloregulator ArsR/SmtB family transcription factor [Candidatus Korobacteraceae bacterium]